ncbi:GDP-mannose 4,6-dehydratase [Streptomyces griseus]|uniref:NAD-dependent epimerase/dehydratase family protein n=1 Tax=Streptomyces TaxID=1883 RepID=UPI0029C1F214|nr:NAD-dependent epimerase/dehydratase family protein [Streptomyces sp. ID01-9D]MDX5576951.1 GDP-mannose 4,6-dehydratase [Streptomyces sp. ID01-9D]WSV19402.1 GDP-mannose 4,6-dehydratase [Streptomyces fimicarius]WTC91436.1 GDP-mannose 4,6-dehydratase [Streptomyces griseus]WTD65931.1 GDP-mannose 4,6-dehydratase [Streptomyces griseus]
MRSTGRALVTGGAGFIGSHLCERLLGEGIQVVCIDNLSTGRLENIAELTARRGFSFVEGDVEQPLGTSGPVDMVFHLASRASPVDYLTAPLETLRAGSVGTEHALEAAQAWGARFILASTSEVYGDPAEHPQRESYWGNVNPVGERSVYDEAKRYAEALTMAYRRSRGLNTAIARIFNTYGPRMRTDDGRIIPNFVKQALAGEPLTVYGSGLQTRTLCYVDDLVDGLLALARSSVAGPVNLGGTEERTVLQLATEIARAAGGEPPVIEHRRLPEDDPRRRRPDLTLAGELLGWRPRTALDDGLASTVAWFDRQRPVVAAQLAGKPAVHDLS